jgi:CDP-4-dehydro-6-deoxyglucose reductase, E1
MNLDKGMRVTFGTVSITDRSKELIRKILSSKRVTCGKLVRELEKRFADVIGSKEAVSVSSGTDAVAIALAVLYDFGAKRQDEIILPALSFVGTGNAVLQAGFKPVFVDIDKKTLNIEPSKIEQVVTRRTRAIVPVHLMGKPAEMDAINSIAKKHKLFVIEDAAEGYGGTYGGKNIGTLGDMAAFSLYAAHIITAVEGGMVVTDRPEFAQILRSLRAHGRACKCESCVLNISSGYCSQRFKYGRNRDIRFIFERVGFSAKMNELEAAIGLGNIETYPEILEKRRKNFLYMKDKIKEFSPYLYTIEDDAGKQVGPHAFPIILAGRVKFTRDELVHFLEKSGIETRSLFSSIPTQCPGFKFLGYKLGKFPNAEYIGENGFHIGIHQDLQKRHFDYVINVIDNFFKRFDL